MQDTSCQLSITSPYSIIIQRESFAFRMSFLTENQDSFEKHLSKDHQLISQKKNVLMFLKIFKYILKVNILRTAIHRKPVEIISLTTLGNDKIYFSSHQYDNNLFECNQFIHICLEWQLTGTGDAVLGKPQYFSLNVDEGENSESLMLKVYTKILSNGMQGR